MNMVGSRVETSPSSQDPLQFLPHTPMPNKTLGNPRKTGLLKGGFYSYIFVALGVAIGYTSI